MSIFYINGRWEELSATQIKQYKRINPSDYELARLNDLDYKYLIAIQVIAKNEERYLKEWITYHLNQGIEFIYIYDNNDKEGLDDYLKSILDEVSYSKIEVIPWRHKMIDPQYDAVYDCVNKHKYDIKWLLTIDVDEFLYLELPIREFLDKYNEASEIYLNWESFNANKELYYVDKPVMDRFKETFICKDKGQGKIIFRPLRLKTYGIHSASLTKGKIVNVLNEEIIPPRSFDNIYRYAWIKHYFTKSLEEWTNKINRGSCDSIYTRKYSLFFDANPDMKCYYDYTAKQEQDRYKK